MMSNVVFFGVAACLTMGEFGRVVLFTALLGQIHYQLVGQYCDIEPFGLFTGLAKDTSPRFGSYDINYFPHPTI